MPSHILFSPLLLLHALILLLLFLRFMLPLFLLSFSFPFFFFFPLLSLTHFPLFAHHLHLSALSISSASSAALVAMRLLLPLLTSPGNNDVEVSRPPQSLLLPAMKRTLLLLSLLLSCRVTLTSFHFCCVKPDHLIPPPPTLFSALYILSPLCLNASILSILFHSPFF